MEENRTVKISAVLTPAQAARLDEFAARHRWSRSAAVAALIDQRAGEEDDDRTQPQR